MGWSDGLRRLRAGKRPADYCYALTRTNDRRFPDAFDGLVFTWDIDKTYLATQFETIKGLLAIPFEFAVDKRNVAGTDVLLRALRRCGRAGDVANGLYFISASPAQLRGVIERKMLNDGVEYDGVTFKDQVSIVRSGKLGRIREQIGFKLSALLLNRRELPWTVSEILFGDDTECDALIYALYADIVAGRLRGTQLSASLIRNQVDPEDAAYVTALADGLEQRELVRRIYINLHDRTPLGDFASFGSRLVPCYDSFQAGLHLLEDSRVGLEPEVVLDVGRELVTRYGGHRVDLTRSGLELVERGALRIDTLAAIWSLLQQADLVPEYVRLERARGDDRRPAAPAGKGFVTPASYLCSGT